MAGKKIIIITGLIIAISVPLTISLIRQQTSTNLQAAPPDKLEAEGGTPNSSVQTIVDTTASGGKYVRLNTASIPTSPPNPSIPPNAVYVPNSIDSTGTTDVQQQLNDFIKSTPDGSIIVFKKDGTYQVGRMIWLRIRKNLTIEGNGATLKLTGNEGNGWWDSGMTIDARSENIIVRNLKIVGNFALAGTPDACCSREGQRGIGVFGSKNVLIENMDITKVGGDCFTLGKYDYDTPATWNDGVTIRNSKCTLTGRMGMHTIGSSNVTFENNYFDQIGYAVFSSEPNDSGDGIRNLIMKNNSIGTYSINNQYTGALYYYSDAWWSDGPTDMSGITITGNTVEGNVNGRTSKMMGLDVRIYENGTGLRENVTVSNNVAKKAVSGPVMTFESVRGVTVTGNTQPLFSGSLISSPGSTNVVVSSNITN